ncbi:peptidyl-prolyl cis-trans isomerase-like 4 [Fonsecaea nubica]|uniref:Peptidyl-prolyl cis-trans isomerase n=1 Tax=Fonsecaea nubica TaxID=856822 RepID=A0A178CCA1_9EURO|nr:peptidyl-prolyl cis-trans isomerase-like 4 [Fonsecaea nubica]OAL26662.1 peptidyl-prolyl cis-trans isomerase-like 4 [Fonsecaea nubica]
MSVILETSLGEVVIDLLVDNAPRCCENFLKLCKIKYYNFSPFHSVQKGFSCQTGDPLGPDSPESDGGSSIWGLLSGPSKKSFTVKIDPKLKHSQRGTVSMATVPSPHDSDERLAGSQFIITLGDDIDYLDGKAAPFGMVVEGFDTLDKINNAFTDSNGRPLKDIRIRHTIILEDPYDDPPGLVVPDSSPAPTKAQLATVMIADDEELDEEVDEVALEKLRREREARAQALTLEMVGDLPFAEVKPPENVLFVCKLNPVTNDEDLELIFSRFGKILSCEVIRDKRTGDSLQYAFIEFENQKDCEQAYFKMQGVLIDDHRIHVDFSQRRDNPGGSVGLRVLRSVGITVRTTDVDKVAATTEWYLTKRTSAETKSLGERRSLEDLGAEVEARDMTGRIPDETSTDLKIRIDATTEIVGKEVIIVTETEMLTGTDHGEDSRIARAPGGTETAKVEKQESSFMLYNNYYSQDPKHQLRVIVYQVAVNLAGDWIVSRLCIVYLFD